MSSDILNPTSMMRVLVYFLRQDPEMTLNRLYMLLLAYKAGKKGIQFKDMQKYLGVSASTISRQLAVLDNRPTRTLPSGLGWCELRSDPADPRRGIVFITPKGESVVKAILDAE